MKWTPFTWQPKVDLKHTDPPCEACEVRDRLRARLRNRIVRRVAKLLGVDDLGKPGDRS